MVDVIHLLTGYEGNSTFIVPKVPTIVWDNAEDNSWYRGDTESAPFLIYNPQSPPFQKLVSDLQQVGGFLRFPPPIELTT
jgi:hypothetical protein